MGVASEFRPRLGSFRTRLDSISEDDSEFGDVPLKSLNFQTVTCEIPDVPVQRGEHTRGVEADAQYLRQEVARLQAEGISACEAPKRLVRRRNSSIGSLGNGARKQRALEEECRQLYEERMQLLDEVTRFKEDARRQLQLHLSAACRAAEASSERMRLHEECQKLRARLGERPNQLNSTNKESRVEPEILTSSEVRQQQAELEDEEELSDTWCALELARKTAREREIVGTRTWWQQIFVDPLCFSRKIVSEQDAEQES